MHQFNDSKNTFLGKKMKTDLVNTIANEAFYQLQYYKSRYLINKRIDEILLILFSTILICLIAIQVF